MGRSVSKSTLGAWLTKKAWLSLAAVVVGLLAASIGMSLLGSLGRERAVEQRSDGLHQFTLVAGVFLYRRERDIHGKCHGLGQQPVDVEVGG